MQRKTYESKLNSTNLVFVDKESREKIESFLDLLACPECRNGLDVDSDSLACTRCAKRFPVVRGVPRFVTSDSYTKSFSIEWIRNRETQLATRIGEQLQIYDFETRTGLEVIKPPRVALECGCGAGRHTELLARNRWRLVAVDLSESVESAHRNVAKYGNVIVIQADINRLPVSSSFDVVFSLGVLHHTPRPHESFRSISRHVKQGGSLSVSVYSNEGVLVKIQNRIGDLYRLGARKIPPEDLYALVQNLCYRIRMPSVVYGDPLESYISKFVERNASKFTLLNLFAFFIPPLALADDFEYRTLNTFDYLSPKYAFKYTYDEVCRWFREEGFSDIKRLAVPVSVIGVRPVSESK